MHTTETDSELLTAIEQRGFVVLQDVLADDEVHELIQVLDQAGKREGIQRRGGVLAIRNLLESVPEIAALAKSPALRTIAEKILGPNCFAVRGILFDKTPDTNWKVAWHQDLTIAVKERRDVVGFGPWSEKGGVDSVQPSSDVLERMITIRVNLDDCGEDNGPVRVLPGTHSRGRLDAAQITEWRKLIPEISTIGPRGAALVMRPLLLHASSAATSPRHRRVIHLDYSSVELPGGLEWHVRV